MFLLEHNLHLSLPPAQYAANTVIPQLSVSGMALVFVPTAKKLDIPYTIATSYDVTNNDSTLICCIV